jgi:TP901 family phage tail tape measure protein
MADMNSNININIDTAQAMAQLRALERQLTSLNRSLIVGSKQNAVYQKQFAQALMHNVNATGKFTASMTTMQTASEQFASKLDKGKLSLREYYRYGMASTKTFGRSFGKEYETLGKVVQKRVKTLQTQYVQLGRNAQGAMQAMQFVPKRLNYDDLNTKLMMSIQRQQLFNKLLSDGSTKLLNFGKNTQWAGRQLMVGFTIPLVMLGAQAIRTFKEIEEQSLRFRKVYGDAFTNEKETQEALGNIRTLAREYTKYGLTIQDTMRIAADAAQMGNTGAELVAQVTEANKLAILGGVEQEKALETTISLTNSFGIAAQDLSSKINFLNAVENQTILSLEDITKAAPIAGNVVKQLGGDVEDLAFFLTAMREGGINANQGANALKSGLARLINPTNTAVKKLNEFGIDMLGIVERNTGNVRNTVLELATSLESLGDIDRARAIETIFGKYQFTRLSTLLQNVTKQGGQAAKVLQVASMEAEELAILSEREMKMQADSPMNRLASSIERLKEQLAPIGEIFAKALIPIAEFFTKMFEKFNNLPEGVKKAIAIVVGAIGTIGPVLLMTVGLVANGIANMLKLFIMMRKGYQQLAFGSTDVALKTQYLTNEELENIAVSNTLYSSHQQLSSVYALEQKSLIALTAQYDRTTASMMRMAKANPGRFMPGAVGRATAQGRVGFNSGTLSVPGTGNTDTVPAILTPGEAVIPKKQSKKYRGLISGIMQDKVPGFALGGVIGQSFSRMFGRSLFGARPGVVPTGSAKVAGSAASLRPQDYYAARDLGNGKLRLTIPSGANDGKNINIVVKQQDKKLIDSILEENISVLPGLKNVGSIKPGTKKNPIAHQYGPGGNLYYNLKRKNFADKELTTKDIAYIRTKTFGFTRTKVNPPGEKATNTPTFVKSRRDSLLRNTPQGKAITNNAVKEFDYLRTMHSEAEIKKFYNFNAGLDTYRANILKGNQGFATSHLKPIAGSRKNASSWTPSQTILDNTGLNAAYKSRDHVVNSEQAANFIKSAPNTPTNNVASSLLKYRQKEGYYQNPTFKMTEMDILRANRNNPDLLKVLKGKPLSYYIRGYNKGIFSVPGPNVNKDVVPAMLTPGEAVIPREQAEKYRPLISGIIAGNVPGFKEGTQSAGLSKRELGRIKYQAQEQARMMRQDDRYLEAKKKLQNAELAYKKQQNRQTAAQLDLSKIQMKEQEKFIRDSAKSYEKRLITERTAATVAAKRLQAESLAAKQQAQQTKEQKKNARQQKRMRFSDAMGKASMASFMIPMVAGGYASQNPDSMIAKNMMPIMLASMLPIILPLFTNIPMAIAAAVTAVVGGIWMYNKKQNDAIKEQARLVDEISATTEKMKKVGQITGEVGATELMARKREGITGDFLFPERKGTTFGSGFISSEVGKADLEAFQSRFELMPDRAMREFALKLASYVSDGVLNAAQATDIARQIGIEMGDQVLGLQIQGKIRELITDNGTDITKEPFEIRIKIAEESISQIQEFSASNGQQLLSVAGAKLNEQAKLVAQLQRPGASTGTYDPNKKNVPTQTFEEENEKLQQLRNEYTALAKEVANQSAQAGALAAQGLESIKAQIDAVEVVTDTEIKRLNEQKKTTKDLKAQELIQKEIDRLENKRIDTVQKLNGLNQEVANTLKDTFKLAQSSGKTNDFFVGLDEAVTNKFKGTGLEAAAKTFNNAAKELGETEVRATIQTQVAAGLLGANQATGLIQIFGEDTDQLNKTLNLFIKTSGVENLNRLQSIVGTFKDKELAKSIVIDFGNMSPEKFQSAYSTLELLKGLNMEEINLENFMRIDNGKAFEDLTKNLMQIEALSDVTAKTVEVELKEMGFASGGIKTLIDNWEYYKGLDPELRKTAIQTFMSIHTVTFATPEARLEWANQLARQKAEGLRSTNKDTFVETYVNNLITTDGTLKDLGKAQRNQFIQEQVEDIIGFQQLINKLTGENKKKAEEKGSTQPSWLDDLLKKLRDVRDNTIQVTKGFDASMKALKKILSGGKDIKIFSGIEQDLTRLGLSDNFIQMMTGMDPEEFEKKKNSLFKFDNKGNIKALREDAKVIEKALLEIALGDFQSKQLSLIKNTQNQTIAIQRLVAAGISTADAFKAVEDAAFAAAVANKNLTDEELKKVVDTLKKANKELRLFQAGANLAQQALDMDSLRDIPKAIVAAKQAFGDLPQSVIQGIIDNADIREFLLQGKFDSEQLRRALQDAQDKAQLEIDIKMQTRDGMQELFDEGYSKAMEWFDAQETKIELDFEFKTLGDQNIIRDAENAIAAIEYKIDDLQAGLTEIEDAETLINDKYDKRVDALEKVENINQSILEQQKSQLTIADAITQGDIGAAAKAVQDMRQQQANAQIEQQKSAIDTARENELAGIRNSLGQSRKQIEDEILKLQKEIFNIEEKTLEPAKERMRLAEIEKNALIDGLTLLGKTKLEWEAVKNSVDLARTNSEEYRKAIQRALDLAKDLVLEWNKIESKKVFLDIVRREITEGGVTTPPTTQSGTTIDGYDINSPSVAPAPNYYTAPDGTRFDTYEEYIAYINSGLFDAKNKTKKIGGGGSGDMVFKAKGGLIPYMNMGGMVKIPKAEPAPVQRMNMGGKVKYMPMGGLVPYMNMGGIFKPKGTDTVPAMLTPGEFVIRKYAVKDFGLDKLKAINDGTYNDGSVYNYNLNLNVKSESNPDQIAETVIAQIKRIDGQRIRGNRQ